MIDVGQDHLAHPPGVAQRSQDQGQGAGIQSTGNRSQQRAVRGPSLVPRQAPGHSLGQFGNEFHCRRRSAALLQCPAFLGLRPLFSPQHPLESTPMAIRVAINGFGRIGRLVFRVLAERGGYEIVAINDLAPSTSLAHLLKYDSVHGRFGRTVEAGEGQIVVDGTPIKALAERDPANLPWAELGVDFVVESTGVFVTKDDCMKHVSAGASKVLLTVPPKGEVDAMIVMGVNEDALKPNHTVISNASCTTNCLAPLAKVLHEAFGIERGLMTTVHAYTNDQRIADMVHKDMRRARSGATNIIPTTTGAARAVGKVIPALNGKLDGYALRVPVPDGSVVDLTANLTKPVSIEDINGALEAAANAELAGILAYTEDPIVSSDIVHDPHSSIIDGLATLVADGGKIVKVVSWYDNEWGYSNRVVDLLTKSHNMSA